MVSGAGHGDARRVRVDPGQFTAHGIDRSRGGSRGDEGQPGGQLVGHGHPGGVDRADRLAGRAGGAQRVGDGVARFVEGAVARLGDGEGDGRGRRAHGGGWGDGAGHVGVGARDGGQQAPRRAVRGFEVRRGHRQHDALRAAGRDRRGEGDDELAGDRVDRPALDEAGRSTGDVVSPPGHVDGRVERDREHRVVAGRGVRARAGEVDLVRERRARGLGGRSGRLDAESDGDGLRGGGAGEGESATEADGDEGRQKASERAADAGIGRSSGAAGAVTHLVYPPWNERGRLRPHSVTRRMGRDRDARSRDTLKIPSFPESSGELRHDRPRIPVSTSDDCDDTRRDG